MLTDSKKGDVQYLSIKSIHKLLSSQIDKVTHEDTFNTIIKDGRNATKIVVDVKGVVIRDGIYYYEVMYDGKLNYVRLLPFEIDMLDRAKLKTCLTCVISSINENGTYKLAQDRASLIDELYEEDTIATFTVMGIRYDYRDNTATKYYILKDAYGLTHRFNSGKEEREYQKGEQLDLYIKGISRRNKHLMLALYNPNLKKASRTFFDAVKVFTEIDEIDSKEQYFDCYFITGRDAKNQQEKDLIGQYNGQSNLWLFTFMNIMDKNVIPDLIKEQLLEELCTVCHIMVKLQKWMIEGSNYLDLFNEETKNETIQKSASQIEKFESLLKAIDIIKGHKQNEFVNDIIFAIQKSGRIAINKEERLSLLKNIMLICPEYITQDISVTCELMRLLLTLGEEVDCCYIRAMVARLNYCVEYDARKIRGTSFRSNFIDISQTIIINEMLSLLCVETLLQTSEKCYDMLNARTAKARFFRILSIVCSDEYQSAILEAGINAAVGKLDDKNVFTWENAKQIDTINLCKLTLQAAVVDRNLDNDYYYISPSSKSGIVILDATGFTIIPCKQCVQNVKRNFYLIKTIRILHSIDTMPLKVGSMYNYEALNMENDAIEQYENWRNITHKTKNLILNDCTRLPIEGDRLLVMVKEQRQPDNLKNLLFVSVVDTDYEQVDGIIDVKQISSRWVEDTRNLFNYGDVFYATTCKTHSGKYSFSIKASVDQDLSLDLKESLKRIVLNTENLDEGRSIPKGLLQEVVLLIDLKIRAEKDDTQRLTLIGYAYCLSAMLSDMKSFYYDFLLKYYASIEKFVNDDGRKIEIGFRNCKLYDRFPNLTNKRNLVEMLSYANSYSQKDIDTLRKLVDEQPLSDIGKLSAMLLAYIYVRQVGLSETTEKDIRNDIKNFIVNTKDIDRSALDTSEDEESNRDTEKVEILESSICSESSKLDEQAEQQTNESTIYNDKEKAHATENIQLSEPLEINIYDNETYTVSDGNTLHIEKGIVTINVPVYALNGILLLLNNDCSYAKISLKNLLEMPKGEVKMSKLNPYKLSHHFVVPTECFFGILTSSDNGQYLEMYDSRNISSCSLDGDFCNAHSDIRINRMQPFILPDSIVDENIKMLIGKRINIKDLSSNIIEEMKDFGVLIK